jgi:hypothetical protein
MNVAEGVTYGVKGEVSAWLFEFGRRNGGQTRHVRTINRCPYDEYCLLSPAKVVAADITLWSVPVGTAEQLT